MKSYIVKSDLVYEQYEEWEKQFIQNDEINASYNGSVVKTKI